MNKEQLKRLFDEKTKLYKDAQAILEEWKGKESEMPAEKQTQVDALLDQMDVLDKQIERLERAAAHEDDLKQPANPPDVFGKTGKGIAKVNWAGRELDADEVDDLKALSPFPGFVKTGSPEGEAYAKALRAYYRQGVKGLSPENTKALAAGESPAGGYLIQDTNLSTLIVKARDRSVMRTISNILPPVPSGSIIAPSEDSVFTDAEWTTELGSGNEDTVKPFGGRRLTPKPMAKRVKVSNTFMRTPTFDVEGYVRDRLAYKFGITGEKGYVNGLGVNDPLGIRTAAVDGKFTTVTTAASLVLAGDDVIDFVYKLPAAYAAMPTTTILCNRALIRKIRKLKASGTGEYLWQPGLQMGSPNLILDTPYALSDQFDDGIDVNDAFEANAIVAVIGDFSFYWIVDAIALSVQRLNELYAETNQTGFIGRMESDGMPVLAEAFLALKIKA